MLQIHNCHDGAHDKSCPRCRARLDELLLAIDRMLGTDNDDDDDDERKSLKTLYTNVVGFYYLFASYVMCKYANTI